MKSYQLIVFDWDGTLMDSTAHIVSCMQQAISDLNFPPLSTETISHIIGLGLIEAATALYPTRSTEQLKQLANKYLDIWRNHPNEPPLFDHATNLLSHLAEQDFFLAVATGKSRRGLDRVLKSTQLEQFFHATRCADECFSKPHPQMLEELMDFLGVNPKDTLMIGDTEYDLNMATNAGADSLGISHGAHNKEMLQACNPKAIVSDLHQIEQWLNCL